MTLEEEKEIKKLLEELDFVTKLTTQYKFVKNHMDRIIELLNLDD